MQKPGQHAPPAPGRSQYRFLRRIATGGMAELYLGEASGVGGVTKRVALKRMLPAHADDEEYLKMFLEEARLTSTLQHPNIVQTYDVIQSGDEYIMVMEFLEGTDLQQFRRRAQAKDVVLTLEHVLYIVRSILSGLHYAHARTTSDGRSRGIVHRDVSPQNIFLTYDGGVKLLDFGIAKTDQSMSGTSSGVLKGKVLYMAPEQCGGGPIDQRTDLYAVGVVLYQLVTGTVPHRGKNAYDTMRSIIDEPAPSPRLTNPRVAPELEAIIMRALHKRPQDRYTTAREMLVDLEAFAQNDSLHVSTVGFSALVEDVLGPRSALLAAQTAEGEALPETIELGRQGEAPQTVPPAPPRTQERLMLLESEHAVVRRIAGVTLVMLSGVLDERFDPSPVVPHLRGEVVLDTGDVSRITSFGIRSLLAMLSESRSAVDHLYHVRCSVPFVNQVTMIRALLAGGRILSFHAPFIDVSSGANFSVLLQGPEGTRALQDHVLPTIPSPSDPTRPAEFDDEPSLYFNFLQDYLEEVPPHLAPVLHALDEQARRLDVELNVRDDLTVLTIRRPVRSDARWKRVVMGLEGRVRIDMSESPSASAAGIESFVAAMESVAPQLQSVSLVGAPLALCESAAQVPMLRGLVGVESVQVDTRCVDCATERLMVIDVTRLREPSPILIAAGCSRCGGTLSVVTDLQDLDTLSTTPGMFSRTAEPIAPAPLTRAVAPQGCLKGLSLFLAAVLVGAAAVTMWIA